MKPLLLLLLTLLLKLPTAGPPAVRVKLSPLTKVAYEAAKKTAVVTRPPMTFPVKKQKGRIVIPTAKGPKLFKDVRVADDETAEVTYAYKGFCAELQQHLLQVSYYESSGWIIVDAAGKVSNLWSPPGYSPSLNRLFTGSGSLEYDMMPNGLQIFQKEPNGLKKIWETAPTTWAPEDAFWTTENTLYVQQRRYRNLEVSDKHYFTYAKLTITPAHE
ncbi:hypothetical protein GCM10027594_17840 [Hymenobacter agri]